MAQTGLKIDLYVSPGQDVGEWIEKLKTYAKVNCFGIGYSESYHQIGHCDIFIAISKTVSWRFPFLRNVQFVLGESAFKFRFSRVLVYNELPEDIMSFLTAVTNFQPMLDVDVRVGTNKSYRSSDKIEFSVMNQSPTVWEKGKYFIRLVWRNVSGGLIENAPRIKVAVQKTVKPDRLLAQMVPLPRLPIPAGNLRLRGWVMDQNSDEVSGYVEIPVRVLR
jgi:hypothetical protein